MKLSEICSYQSERVKSNTLSVENYISTENMLPNKSGVSSASKVPPEAAVLYKKGDILISNIRPYFKKIWQAQFSGGCSSDVLCIRANSRVNQDYLYYLLSQDSFFDYVMAGAKGSKMPRGDKKQIMDWDVELPKMEEQIRIASLLRSIDDKIALNNRINHNLEEQADTIIASLIDNYSHNAKLKDISFYVNEKIDTSGFNIDDYISTENINPNKSGISTASSMPECRATVFNAGDTLVSNIRPYFKKIWRANKTGVCSNDVLCFRSSISTPSSLYHLLRQDSFFDYVMLGAKGSKMPRGDKEQIMNWEIPSIIQLCQFEQELARIDKKSASLMAENYNMTKQRDMLLPKLMSGELTC